MVAAKPTGRFPPPVYSLEANDHKMTTPNQSQFILDYDIARSGYIPKRAKNAAGNWVYEELESHPEYGYAYLTSTEELDKSITMFDGHLDNVLTVAASGEQALRYTLAGAKHIDTFDLTYFAKVVQDLKTTALPVCNRAEFYGILNNMHLSWAVDFSVEDLINKLPNLPSESARALREMQNCPIFGIQSDNPYYARQKPLTGIEYAKLQQTVKRPFNFIWTDIRKLHTQLNQKYDVINISNIFDWTGKYSIVPILQNLFPYLKPNGYIISTLLMNGWDTTKEQFDIAAKNLRDRATFDYKDNTFQSNLILRRTR